MGIQFTVYPVAGLVSYAVDGPATDAQAGAFLAAVVAHPHFQRGFDFLGEGGGPGEPDAAYSPPLARAVRSRTADVAPCRWAVVVSSHHGPGAVRRWAELVLADGIEVAPFLSRSDAVDWLADYWPPPTPCHDRTMENS